MHTKDGRVFGRVVEGVVAEPRQHRAAELVDRGARIRRVGRPRKGEHGVLPGHCALRKEENRERGRTLSLRTTNEHTKVQERRDADDGHARP
jgi:hypothetical protein